MNNLLHNKSRNCLSAVCLLAVAGLLSVGCDKASWKDPGARQTFETFLMQVFRGDAESAFAAIAPEDRAVLTAPLDELKGLPADVVPEPHQMWVITAVDNPYDVKRVEPVEELDSEPELGHKLQLKISYHDGREGSATMVWGGERWFVDLPLDDKKAADKPAKNGT